MHIVKSTKEKTSMPKQSYEKRKAWMPNKHIHLV